MDIHHLRRSALCTRLGAVAILLLSSAASASAADLVTKAPAQTPPQDDLWTRDKLTGDWGGLRTALHNRGIDFTFNYTGEILGMLGGIRQGVSYEHRLELWVDTDLDKLLGWKGASTQAKLYQIGHAHGLPAADFTGSIADPSNIEALPSTRLFTAWFQQNFYGDKVSLRLGQIAADDEFLISNTAGNLINSTFGYAALLAADQPACAQADRRDHGPVGGVQRRPGRGRLRRPAARVQPLRHHVQHQRRRAVDGGGAIRDQPGQGRQGDARRLEIGRLVRDHELP
jgi:carbohydrate-selective porin OprB